MELPLFKYEKDLLDRGITHIAGVDEVGRGPLAGPMVVCSVVLNLKKILDLLSGSTNNDVESKELTAYGQINDSKKLTAKKRELLDVFIRNELISYSIVEASQVEIDTIGISKLTQTAFYASIKKLSVKPDHILTDTFEIKKLTKDCQTNIIRGDSKSISIAAASIIAKVYRDKIMDSFDEIYPQYGFKNHKGYGTKAHMEALKRYGPCDIHRKSFAPVSSFYL